MDTISIIISVLSITISAINTILVLGVSWLGNATGGAPSRNDITENIGMALQARLQKAQIENIEADTKKKESETTGVDLANKWESYRDWETDRKSVV